MKTITKESLEQLKQLVGESKALEIVKLQEKCDNYLLKFKKDMNKLLLPHEHEVLCGIAFRKVEK